MVESGLEWQVWRVVEHLEVVLNSKAGVVTRGELRHGWDQFGVAGVDQLSRLRNDQSRIGKLRQVRSVATRLDWCCVAQ